MSVKYDVELKDGEGNTIIPYIGAITTATDAECISLFMEEVNKKANKLRMTSSTFGRASGDSNCSTNARDLLRLGIAACDYPSLLRVWGCDRIVVMTKEGKSVTLATTVKSTELESYYTLLGGKTGSMSGVRNLLVIGIVEGKIVCGVIMNATSDANRFVAMKQLFDIAKKTINGQSVSSDSVTEATSAIIAVVPQIPSAWNDTDVQVLFEQNADTVTMPASVTKVITALTMLDHVKDLNEKITFIASDLIGGSGSVFANGDTITYEDALYAMMLPSSNMAAQCIARNVGLKILALKS